MKTADKVLISQLDATYNRDGNCNIKW